jgi:YHS domain-containing protein
MTKTLLSLFLFLCLWSPLGAKEPAKKAGLELKSGKKEKTVPCMVCRHYGDSACLTVEVDDSTPQAEYQGKTYYFCSPSCRKEFLRKPKKYTRELSQK